MLLQSSDCAESSQLYLRFSMWKKLKSGLPIAENFKENLTLTNWGFQKINFSSCSFFVL